MDTAGNQDGSGPAPTGAGRGSGRVWQVVAAGFVLAAGGASAWLALASPFDHPRVGECVTVGNTTGVTAVACDGAGAKYRVVQVLEGQPRPSVLAVPCAREDASYWQGGSSGTGRLLCLQPL